MRVLEYLRPLLPGIRDYRPIRGTWRGDLLAGITVGIVALPLALAFGVTSGVGAEAGLVTAIVAGMVAAIFGGSNIQVSGPTGAMVVVLAPIVVSHGVGAVAIVAVMAGILVVAAGVTKIGRVVAFIPWPVIEGFTLGIAAVILLQQVPAALGVRSVSSTNALIAAGESLGVVDVSAVWWPLAVVVLVAAIMVLAPRIHPRLPGSIIGIVLVTALNSLLHLPLVTIGRLPEGLPAPAVPHLAWDVVSSLSGPALTVAALAAIESLLSARVGASLADTGTYDPDRELVGQGLASIAAGFFGGMPATGAIARTAVNVRSGGRTRLSAIVHALVLVGVVYLASGIVSQIPVAALAGVLIVTAARMTSLATVRSIVGSTRSDTVVFIVTAIITVSFDLIVAVGIGIAVAMVAAIRALSKASGVHREELPGAAVEGDIHIALFRLDGALFFGAAERVLERVNEISDVHVVILRLSQLQVLDATGARVVTEMIQALERRGITVLVKGIQERHLKLATRVGVISSLRHDKHLFDDLDAAVAHARSHVARAASGPRPR
ncbi:MAG: SulP family inorganic anion transporter [Salinibacterium sp.]|nr:MAG: SulP family inorganic anion transporter [Salinibacterium sp.]